jgi:hypothetical protein
MNATDIHDIEKLQGNIDVLEKILTRKGDDYTSLRMVASKLRDKEVSKLTTLLSKIRKRE